MNLPFEYDRVAVGEFGGTTPDHDRFRPRPRRDPAGSARPHDVVRARHAQRPARDPRRLLAHGAVGRGDARPTSTASASSRCRRWSFRSRRWTRWCAEIRRVASELVNARQVPVRARRRALDHRRRSSPPSPRSIRGLSVLQIDAHADLRDSLHGHAAQPRLRDAAGARIRARPRRSASAACRPRKRRPRRRCRPTIFYDFNMRQRSRTGSIASSTR